MNLSVFKNRHKGERCFIVCNGPSLNKMDLSLLRGEIVFGLNKIYLGLSSFGFFPRYLVAVNEKVIKQSVPEFLKLNCVKFIGDRFKGRLKEGPLLWRIETENYFEDFSLDIQKGIQEGNTVTYAAIQIAYYMGFSEVVIIGMDHRFEFAGKTNESQFMAGEDRNHFTTKYFENSEWDTPDLIRSEQYYHKAKHIFERSGRKIVDATIGGACDIFDKVDYMECFNRMPQKITTEALKS